VDLQARRRIFESWPKKRTLKVGSWVEQVYQSPGYDWWNQLRPHLSGDFSNSVNVLYVSFIIYIYIYLSLSFSLSHSLFGFRCAEYLWTIYIYLDRWNQTASTYCRHLAAPG
jgi:hypothetical protein